MDTNHKQRSVMAANATPPAAPSSKHWSGVDPGGSFTIELKYDAAKYDPAHHEREWLVPFLSSAKSKLKNCALGACPCKLRARKAPN